MRLTLVRATSWPLFLNPAVVPQLYLTCQGLESSLMLLHTNEKLIFWSTFPKKVQHWES
jgi:hypothetical protein